MNVPIPEPDEWSGYIPRLDKNCSNINPPTLVRVLEGVTAFSVLPNFGMPL